MFNGNRKSIYATTANVTTTILVLVGLALWDLRAERVRRSAPLMAAWIMGHAFGQNLPAVGMTGHMVGPS